MCWIQSRGKETVSLQTVTNLLNDDELAVRDEEKVVTPTGGSTRKKDYNTTSIPSKLEAPASEMTGRKSLRNVLFYPLFLLYPLLVSCLR